jgi:predicted PurR-regulated permease PerM
MLVGVCLLLFGLLVVIILSTSEQPIQDRNDVIRYISNVRSNLTQAIDYVMGEIDRLKEHLRRLSRKTSETNRRQANKEVSNIMQFNRLASDVSNIHSTQESHLDLILFNDRVLESAFPRDRQGGFDDGHSIFDRFLS